MAAAHRPPSPDRPWDRARTFALIDEFRGRRLLWDAADSGYYSRERKAEAWRAVAAALACPLDEVRRKINSLMAGFRREVHKSRMRGDDGYEYESSWFAYQKMAFLLERKGREKGEKSINYHFLDDNESKDDFVKLECPDSEVDLGENFFEGLAASTCDFKEKEKNGQDFNDDCLSLGSLDRPTSSKRKAPASVTHEQNQRDPCEIFGELVASKLRSYDKRTRCIVEFEISKVLFEADMGKYDRQYDIQTGADFGDKK